VPYTNAYCSTPPYTLSKASGICCFCLVSVEESFLLGSTLDPCAWQFQSVHNKVAARRTIEGGTTTGRANL
jgi:hypothetical protein